MTILFFTNFAFHGRVGKAPICMYTTQSQTRHVTTNIHQSSQTTTRILQKAFHLHRTLPRLPVKMQVEMSYKDGHRVDSARQTHQLHDGQHEEDIEERMRRKQGASCDVELGHEGC